MYQNIIFDLDGTLLNTLEDLTDSVNYALKCNGFAQREQREIRRFVGNGIGKLIARAVPEGTETTEVEKVLADFREHYQKNCRNKTKPYAGILLLLIGLKEKGYRTAIVSNKNQTAVDELAKEVFLGLVDVAIGEREGIPRKPAPDSTWEAMELLGANKNNTLYVGDSDVDRETAKNAGIACVSVTWGFRDEEELRLLKPEYMIRKAEELWEILEGKQK